MLFTSYQQMRQIYDRVSFAIEYPVLLQGTGPRTALLEEFRETPHCILFATGSFWQGVDVPGDQLSCVIIDKLPFAVPSDPVVEARIRNVREAGGESASDDYQISQAAISLKQGFYRLIRDPVRQECSRCSIIGLRSNATDRYFLTVCRTTHFPCASRTWRNFSRFEVLYV